MLSCCSSAQTACWSQSSAPVILLYNLLPIMICQGLEDVVLVQEDCKAVTARQPAWCCSAASGALPLPCLCSPNYHVNPVCKFIG